MLLALNLNYSLVCDRQTLKQEEKCILFKFPPDIFSAQGRKAAGTQQDRMDFSWSCHSPNPILSSPVMILAPKCWDKLILTHSHPSQSPRDMRHWKSTALPEAGIHPKNPIFCLLSFLLLQHFSFPTGYKTRSPVFTFQLISSRTILLFIEKC